MNQLPEFFKYASRNNTETTLQPFSYNAANKMFLVANIGVPLEDFEPYLFSPFDIGLDDKGVAAEEVGQDPLYLPILPGRLVVSPSLHEWAETNPIELSEAWQVIGAAYRHLSGTESENDFLGRPSKGYFGFEAGLRKYGGIHLQTIGSCACMGPAIDGIYIDGQFENGYGEYDMHNADTAAQRTSLFAGMGHLAYLTAAGHQ